MKKHRNLLTLILAAFFLSACGNFDLDFRKLDTPAKQYQFAQEEWIDALTQYKGYLNTQTEAQQAKLHDRYDAAIKDVDAALDVWGAFVNGRSDNPGGHSDFLEAKNKLLRLGFSKFFQKEGQ